MDILQNIVQYILDLGAAVFVPFLMFIIALCMRMKVKDAFTSALTLGIAFTGMNLLVNFIMTSMGAAANDLATNTGLSLPAVDIGWPGAASITWAWPYAFLMFPVQIGIDYCHTFVPLMPTFLPLFAKECTTFCQLDVPLKKYPITTVI